MCLTLTCLLGFIRFYIVIVLQHSSLIGVYQLKNRFLFFAPNDKVKILKKL